ncbi:hypothetical protein CLOSTHATH_06344 [Hungatella hathewayi DSM 13479]|uniref:Uncharacterized protein n=1 Tax=Hungatella hathewayi DSM 13479 TaxID=566550 RepID=D3ART8_9FIRM|nr:hypothetical protein CLOSTHATH_06344 [Hungatella hathewayi DSM 13479]
MGGNTREVTRVTPLSSGCCRTPPVFEAFWLYHFSDCDIISM